MAERSDLSFEKVWKNESMVPWWFLSPTLIWNVKIWQTSTALEAHKAPSKKHLLPRKDFRKKKKNIGIPTLAKFTVHEGEGLGIPHFDAFR